MTETEIDRAYAAMTANPDDDIARLRFHERLADCELFLLLVDEPEGDTIEPHVFGVEDQQFAVVFDTEERLAAFAGEVAPYAGMPGRVLAGMLAGQGIGLALNPEVAPSATLIAAEAVDWLVATLAGGPVQTQARPKELFSPKGLPEVLLQSLDRKLATAGGAAQAAYLASVTYDDDSRGHLLAFVGAPVAAEDPLARAVSEALVFSGIDAGMLDVIFVDGADAVVAKLARVGLRFDLPTPPVPEAPSAPGMDPDKPPKLR
jgi:hypothetical protein